MPRRREFGLFHVSINGDLTMVFKGSIGEINRWAKVRGWTFRRDSRNIFGGYWVDEQTGDSYGADIIGGRRGQVRNPMAGASISDRNWREYWRDHASIAARIYKDVRKKHPESDEEMIEEETANVLMGLHDSPIRTATFDEDIAADLAWVARHTVERPKEFLAENPICGEPRTVLDFTWEIMELKRREGPSVKDKFTLAESGFGVAVTSARKIGARRVKYIDITAASGDKFQVTGYAGSDARLRSLGYPKAIQTSDANEAANYLSTIYAIRHAPGTRR